MRRGWQARSRRFTLGFLATTLGLWAAVALFNLAYDPLYFLWPKPLFAKRYTNSTAYLFAGLPRTHPAQLVVAGQSHSQNFRISDLRATFGLDALNLALPASTAREDALALNLALKAGPVRRVLWEMSLGVLRVGPQHLNESFAFPVALYGEGWLTTARYLASIEVFDIGVELLAGRGERDLDHYGFWGDRARFGCAEVMRSAGGALKPWVDAPLSPADLAAIDAARASFEVNVLGLARAHPEVRFDLFLPPASTAAYSGNLRVERALWELLVEGAAGLPNMRVFNFRPWAGVVDDYELYKDTVHYRPEINRRMLAEIAAERMRMTRANLETDWAALIALVGRRQPCGPTVAAEHR